MKNLRVFFKMVIVSIILLSICSLANGQTPITTVEELAALNNGKASLGGNYILMSDLTLNNWTPVGSYDGKNEQGFSGTFDGNGHTITITGFNSSCDNPKIGLFSSIEKDGIVKNLCMTGNINYTCSQRYLYIGSITGINYGLITCCAAKITMESDMNFVKKGQEKGMFGYEDGCSGGCIAGINMGTISNCYSTGSVLISISISGKGNNLSFPASRAGGIAGGNGQVVGSSIGISAGSGGGGISVSQGKTTVGAATLHCYSTASVISKGTRIVASGGIAAISPPPSGLIANCVSLNKTIEAYCEKGGSTWATPVASIGYINYRSPNVFFSDNIFIREYKNGQEKKPDKFSQNNTVAFLATQEQSWWRYPEGLTEKQRNQEFGFLFGEDEQFPWVWDDDVKRPVLYWEKNEN